MIRVSWSRFVIALLVNVAICFVLAGALAASKHSQNVEGLDHLIPREKWAGAGLDKLTNGEQQALAEDITSLLGSPQGTGSGAVAGRDRSQWRKLQRHMSKDEVKKFAGRTGAGLGVEIF
jgi:hypothetical protein